VHSTCFVFPRRCGFPSPQNEECFKLKTLPSISTRNTDGTLYELFDLGLTGDLMSLNSKVYCHYSWDADGSGRQGTGVFRYAQRRLEEDPFPSANAANTLKYVQHWPTHRIQGTMYILLERPDGTLAQRRGDSCSASTLQLCTRAADHAGAATHFRLDCRAEGVAAADQGAVQVLLPRRRVDDPRAAYNATPHRTAPHRTTSWRSSPACADLPVQQRPSAAELFGLLCAALELGGDLPEGASAVLLFKVSRFVLRS
jgi:hypothetical protein